MLKVKTIVLALSVQTVGPLFPFDDTKIREYLNTFKYFAKYFYTFLVKVVSMVSENR